MSQNDFTIANQTFPNTRADINSALQALASTSSGTSAPSTTFANQFWYDTSANTLYIRNEDNDANITLAVLDQSNDTVEYFKSDSAQKEYADAMAKLYDRAARTGNYFYNPKTKTLNVPKTPTLANLLVMAEEVAHMDAYEPGNPAARKNPYPAPEYSLFKDFNKLTGGAYYPHTNPNSGYSYMYPLP